MKRQHWFLLLGTVLILTQVIHSCKNWSQTSRPDDTASNYLTYCAGCHDDRLEKFAAKQWMDETGSASIERSIREGIPAIGMPAFANTFNDKEIKELADYVKQGIPSDRSLLKPAVTANGIIRSEAYNLVIDTVVTGLEVPWGLAFLPDGNLLISERKGRLHTFSQGKLSAPIEGLPPIMAFGQGGLLDLALHPEYDKNGWIYISYSALDTTSSEQIGSTGVMRARLKGNRLTDQQILFTGSPATDKGHHWGCKLAFDGKGYLFFGVGERGQHFDFPQRLDNTNGKIHRIHDDGRIPADNPFVETPGAIPSIYSYGHRNPQGTVVHPLTGEVWETEHGPMGGDELNLIKPGLNYGWPVISYGINYDGTILTELTEKEGMEQPVFQWTPSIAPCGMTVVTGNRFKRWENNLLVGSLRFDYVERMVLEGDKVIHTEKLVEGIGRVRNVVMSPDGLVYIGLEEPGMIVRLVPVE
ncbi:PQQ-dependent sugar dehydrogenase [Petrimonas mucosa]|uniref:Soluble aldose sugar dehydrogenase YliI n=1 Tax=Petrimonas mucosa TaxID=1642646 RepID=A0A1G4G676_9BACT|nr:PQQ-dependent sugar dehydrogenase [Petrimonas mucosa]SCM56925.1 Soluble aldose sugar dehydrogenase YliI [Petrimonas mucosa]